MTKAPKRKRVEGERPKAPLRKCAGCSRMMRPRYDTEMVPLTDEEKKAGRWWKQRYTGGVEYGTSSSREGLFHNYLCALRFAEECVRLMRSGKLTLRKERVSTPA